MDSSYLPILLDNILKDFSTNIGLSSWRIYGGISNQTTVTIRFGQNSLDQRDMDTYIAYRRKPPTAQHRDKQRLEEFNVKQSSTVSHSSPFNIPSMDTNNIINFVPGAPSHGLQTSQSGDTYSVPPLPSLPPQVDGLCDTLPLDKSPTIKTDLPVDQVKGLYTFDMGLSGDLNYGNEHGSDLCLGYCSEVSNIAPMSSSPPYDIDNPECSKIPDAEQKPSFPGCDGKYMHCASCKQVMKSFDWYKCTKCIDNDDQYDMCSSCYDNLHHNEHGDNISHFKAEIAGQGEKMYCDACGVIFFTQGTTYYHCKGCENGKWNFDMCNACYHRRYHPNHRKYLEKKKLGTTKKDNDNH